MVNGHRTVGNLVKAVTVDISHAQVVVALSGIAFPFRFVGIEHPAAAQFLAVPIPCRNDRAGVVAAAEEGRGHSFFIFFLSKVAYGSEIAFRAVAAIVAPVSYVTTGRDIGFRVHRFASKTIEHSDILRSLKDAA